MAALVAADNLVGRRLSSPPSCQVCGHLRKYTVSLRQAREAASAGCEVCAMLSAAATTIVQQEESTDQNQPQNCDQDLIIAVHGYTISSTLAISLGSSSYIAFTTSDTCLWDKIKPMPLPSSNSGSPEVAALISKWITGCSANHSRCSQAPKPLPTRILDVGHMPQDAIKLCSGDGRLERYCALSHCWGSSQILRTTKSTLPERHSGILPNSLPQTFQDAIVVSRRLKIRFLWIDSLCIIQDDLRDWEQESVLMASVYGNAYLVISATHASQGHVGCFSQRTTLAPFYTYKPFSNEPNEEIPVYIKPATKIHKNYEPMHMYTEEPNDLLPLLSRAWCFQERLLATRVLHFAGEDVVWECRTKTLCECGALNRPSFKKSMKTRWIDECLSSATWHKLLSIYMSRNITFPSDRLPAISGVVKEMQRAGHGEYHAGIWKENLFPDLLWEAVGERTSKWQAPSWSWASLDKSLGLTHAVRLNDLPECHFDHVNLRQREYPGMDTEGRPFTATLKSIESTPAGEDSTGRVTSASLTISVPLVTVTVRSEPRDEYDCGNICKDGMELKFKHDCDEDYVDLEKLDGGIVCIWVGTIWTDGKDKDLWPQFMILRPSIGIGGTSPNSSAYERVGIIFFEPNLDKTRQTEIVLAWFKEAKVTEVTIV